jgi:hypothetical protein
MPETLVRLIACRTSVHGRRSRGRPPPIRSIVSDQIGYGQRYLIDIENAAISGVNTLGNGTSLHAETFSIRASFLHIEVAHVSIGVHNEHFLHHRRRRRNSLRCGFLRAARLNGTPIRALSRSTEEIGMAEIKEHMEVIGADGVHVGTVDKIEGKRIKLTKADSGEGKHKGHHHFIDLSLVAEVEGQKVRLSANADVAATMEEEKA